MSFCIIVLLVNMCVCHLHNKLTYLLLLLLLLIMNNRHATTPLVSNVKKDCVYGTRNELLFTISDISH